MLNSWEVANGTDSIKATHRSLRFYTEVYEYVPGIVHFRIFNRDGKIEFDSIISKPSGYGGIFAAINAAHQWRALQ